MTRWLWALGLLVTGLACGCAPAADDSAGNAKELTKEMPKSDPNTEALPSPLKDYEPTAGTPPGAPKK